jgi:hypothetical protein
MRRPLRAAGDDIAWPLPRQSKAIKSDTIVA